MPVHYRSEESDALGLATRYCRGVSPKTGDKDSTTGEKPSPMSEMNAVLII